MIVSRCSALFHCHGRTVGKCVRQLSRSCVRNRGVPRILSANDADFRNLWSQNRFATVQQDQKHKDRGSAGNSRSEEHTSELQSLMRISYAVFCLKKKTYTKDT